MLQIEIMEYFSLVILCVVTEVSVESDWVPVLVHCVHVLPGVSVLEKGVVVPIAVWSWLITVNLSLPEEIGVVVASSAGLHLLSYGLAVLDRV